ncbi:FMN-dependent NADH-azoreductase [Herbaspirillum sp. Sphag1AN]|uniref:FMN-dependent NADH-azoreductase n=1 Tax=unclassified Herbaspirillum TaxID=2624150 RepID=UPI00161D53B8|nr:MULTISPECIES: NAD(P)H-dependent oxidoreductase [unclassified Herbaspirillum]MBB3212744.1 FMN-dependent NADH-azoreductase [Herbaspirillum sp. Sphag1AN]MBB3245941.1 FMN-dependent NADH-azoreductase [Herbaspirillum sp. Sphag64]
MKTLRTLVIDCSPRGGNATSRHLTKLLLPKLADYFGQPVTTTYRRLGVTPPEPISADYADSLLIPVTQAKEQYGAVLTGSDTLIEELKNADVLWISTPVHNFTVPAVLKNWIDLVVRKDVTFVTTETGKHGLLPDRPVFVAVTSGGSMFAEHCGQPDFFRPYLRAILGVIGLTDITFIPVTGLAREASPLEVVATRAAEFLKPTASQCG